MTAGPPASLFAGTGLGEECVRVRGGIVEFANRESSEQIAWRESLGADIRVKPFPDYVTNDVERRLSELGFGLIIYLPYLSLQERTLRKLGPEAYVKELSRTYPRWNPFEDLSFAQKTDHNVPRNLMRWFWDEVRNRRIEFPQLPGRWMAVEDVKKPAAGQSYARSLFTEMLGMADDRIGRSWTDLSKRMESTKHEVLSYLGIQKQPMELRFPEAIEYNLLANREGWAKTNNYEWTNTKFREKAEPDPEVFEWWAGTETGNDRTYRLIAGNSLLGGAGKVTTYDPDRSDRLIGFRCAIIFGSTVEEVTVGKLSLEDEITRRNCELLGLSSNELMQLSDKELEKVIETSFRAMALRCHPDLGGTNEKMQQIITAREQLRKKLFTSDFGFRDT